MKKNNNYDLIVGIPSFMEADNISFVTDKIDQGLTKYFPKYKSIIVNVDNNSKDDTKGAFLSTKTKTKKKYITTPKGVKGKGNNFYNLFKETYIGQYDLQSEEYTIEPKKNIWRMDGKQNYNTDLSPESTKCDVNKLMRIGKLLAVAIKNRTSKIKAKKMMVDAVTDTQN